MKKTSSFQNGLIWFGAAVSIAEILTGTYFAPLGFTKGLLAILLGHVIGCAMFFFAGLIGGRIGCLFFAALNVLQLVGWTSIMIYDGALATNTVLGIGKWVWCLVIGGLIVLWIAIGIKNLGWVNKIAMAALFILSIVLCVVVFRGGTPVTVPDDSLSFGAAVELAVAMPLSWLPLISDYTREAEKPFAATLSSTLTYGVVSCWMYLIGMGAAIFTGEGDIALIMVKAGLGVAALLILILSTEEDQRQVCRAHRDRHRHGLRHLLPDGRHHELPLPHRFGVRADDRHPDHGLLPAAPRRRARKAGRVQRRRLGAGLRALPRAHERGHPGRQYAARHGRHDASVRDRAQARPRQDQGCLKPFCEICQTENARTPCGRFLRVKQSLTRSNETHCVGLSFEKIAARCSARAVRARLRAERYFLRRTCRRRK